MELPGAKRLGDDRRPLGTLRCWRHSDIGPARGIVVTPALKEWSAAVHALLDGRQTVLLRKGGIGEKRPVPGRGRSQHRPRPRTAIHTARIDLRR